MRALILVAAAPLFVASLVGNAAQRAFVSTSGNDANAASGCSVSAPCRSFDIAIGAVAGGGEVIALESGGYGRFSATKSVTVVAPAGVHAGISVFAGTNGVDINTAGVNVILRGLSISGQGGVHGIYFQNGASLVVENCTIDSMVSGSGIRVAAAGASNAHPSLTYVVGTRISASAYGLQLSDGPASVTVSRSSFAGNGDAIRARGTLGFVENSIAVANSTLANNGNGVLVLGETTSAIVGAMVDRSTLMENDSNGIYATAVTGSTVVVTATENMIARNFNGVSADATGAAKIVLEHNTVTRNRQIGVFVGMGSVIETRTDNQINDNAQNVQGSMTPTVGQ